MPSTLAGGSILFWMPSRPAATVLASTRYGLEPPPGRRFSMWAEALPGPLMRKPTVRFSMPQVALVGANE